MRVGSDCSTFPNAANHSSPEDHHDHHMSSTPLTHNAAGEVTNNPGELGHCGPSGAAQLLAGVASAVSSDLNLLAASLPQAPIPPHEFAHLADCYDQSIASSSTEDSTTTTSAKVYAPEYISL